MFGLGFGLVLGCVCFIINGGLGLCLYYCGLGIMESGCSINKNQRTKCEISENVRTMAANLQINI